MGRTHPPRRSAHGGRLLRLTGRFPVNSPRPSGTGNSIPAVIPASPEPAATPGPIVDGIAQFLWATDAGGPGFVSRPGFTNFDPAGQIWVSNAETGQYVIYDADGAFIETWGEAGTGPGQFNFFSPAGADLGDVAFAADGSFFVADTGNHRVQKFAADRTFLLSWGDSGDGTADGELRGAGLIVILSDGTLLVADYERNDIQQFAADGTFLGSFAKEDATNTALRGPAGMTVGTRRHRLDRHGRRRQRAQVQPDRGVAVDDRRTRRSQL